MLTYSKKELNVKNTLAGPVPVALTGITRQLGPRDKAALMGHFLRLNSEDRTMRFFSPVGDASINAYVEAINWARTVLIGHFAGARLVGLAEVIPTGPRWQRCAEVAVSVEPDWRRHGLGKRLLDRAMAAARAVGLRQLRLVILPDNHTMVRLARGLGGKMRSDSGVVTAQIALWPERKMPAWLEHLAGALASAPTQLVETLHWPHRHHRRAA